MDRDGVIRFRETYQPGDLPDPAKILEVVESLP